MFCNLFYEGRLRSVLQGLNGMDGCREVYAETLPKIPTSTAATVDGLLMRYAVVTTSKN